MTTSRKLSPPSSTNRVILCDVSVIIPVLNEESSIPVLAEEIERAFGISVWSWECLWVDDGSTDGTLFYLRQLHRREPRHRFFSLDRNHGQSAALAIGFSHALGRIIATLDGDLQNDPADLPCLIANLETSDLHMINGVRVSRQDSLRRRIVSVCANAFRDAITRTRVRDAGCSTRVFYRECVENIPAFKAMHRFLPTLVEMHGYRMEDFPVNHRPRAFGRSKYGFHDRVWAGILDTLAVSWLQKRAVRAAIRTGSYDDRPESTESRYDWNKAPGEAQRNPGSGRMTGPRSTNAHFSQHSGGTGPLCE